MPSHGKGCKEGQFQVSKKHQRLQNDQLGQVVGQNQELRKGCIVFQERYTYIQAMIEISVIGRMMNQEMKKNLVRNDREIHDQWQNSK